ncbi:MAG: sulfatase-like hydrolase/transferase [Planctomycetales bacterium]
MRLLILLVSILFAPSRAVLASKPNFVIILADDLGYGDVQCYNPTRGKIPTPNIDRLASEGCASPTATALPPAAPLDTHSSPAAITGVESRLQHGICQLWETAHHSRPHDHRQPCPEARLSHRVYRQWHLGWNWPIPADQMQHFKGLGGQAGAAVKSPPP